MSVRVDYKNAVVKMSDKLQVRRYSSSTYKVYMAMFKSFLRYTYPSPLHHIRQETILAYHKHIVIDRKVSSSYQNQSINAIKFYVEHVLGLERTVYELDRPRKEQRLPKVLAQKEVAAILNNVRNVKHKAILSTIYGCGLRISECASLKIVDIDSINKRIWVRSAKGNKDRITLLPDSLLDLLRIYYKACKPKIWLFESPDGKEYSVSSIRKVFNKAKRIAKVNKPATGKSVV